MNPKQNICCVSIQGLHPSKDPTFVAFEGESFRETLLIASAVGTVEPLELFLVASPDVLPLRHNFFRPGSRKSPFSLFLSLFFGRAKNLGICEATKHRSSASSKHREKKDAFVGLHL